MDALEVKRLVREEMRRYVLFQFCPTCNDDVQMVRVARGEGPTTWLCLGCLKHYQEKLEPTWTASPEKGKEDGRPY